MRLGELVTRRKLEGLREGMFAERGAALWEMVEVLRVGLDPLPDGRWGAHLGEEYGLIGFVLEGSDVGELVMQLAEALLGAKGEDWELPSRGVDDGGE